MAGTRAVIGSVRALIAVGIAVIVMVGVLVAAASLWFRNAVYLDRDLPRVRTSIVVDPGMPFTAVVERLRKRGVLAHPLAFRLLARLRHDETSVRAGEYAVEPQQSSDQILRMLVAGAAAALWVTIPEGFTSSEIGERLAQRNVGDAQAFARYAQRTTMQLAGARTASLEGYLFPSTYLVPVGATPARIADILTTQFRSELPADAAQRARALHHTVPEIITLASLIEREAKADDERPLMASVYYNRLRAGMPLEVDATIEYIFPEHKTVISARDLAIDSPYNTYRHTGLPPTPIANPGKASIDAAFGPQSSPYYFYVYKGNGHHAFARTLDEHNANVERYLH